MAFLATFSTLTHSKHVALFLSCFISNCFFYCYCYYFHFVALEFWCVIQLKPHQKVNNNSERCVFVTSRPLPQSSTYNTYNCWNWMSNFGICGYLIFGVFNRYWRWKNVTGASLSRTRCWKRNAVLLVWKMCLRRDSSTVLRPVTHCWVCTKTRPNFILEMKRYDSCK